MQDAPARMNKSATCTGSDAQLTHDGSLKVLQRLADQVEHGDPALKESRGFYLRKLYRTFTGGQVPN